MKRLIQLVAASSLALGALLVTRGCAEPDGCRGGDDGTCVPPSACEALAYTCSDRSLEIRRSRGAVDRGPGLNALSAAGDVLLKNGRISVALDDLGAPHYLAPGGGSVLDLAPREGDDDLNQIFQAAGILPGDAVKYQSMELIDRSPELVAVVLRGHLDGRPRVTVVTRYELRPCEPGLRVRTDLHHGGRDAETFFLSDAFYWGDRAQVPFVPLAGRGFSQPELKLESIGDAFAEQPFMASRGQRDAASSYGVVPCGRGQLTGFHSTQVSAVGLPRTVLLPGDSLSLERFIVTGPGPGLAGAADLAMEAREKMFGEHSVTVSGRVLGGRPSLLFYEGEPGARTPLTEATPGPDGTFHVRVPANRTLRIEPHVLGRPVPQTAAFQTGRSDSTIADVVVPAAGVLDVRVRGTNGLPRMAEVVLTPAEPTRASDVDGSTHGVFAVPTCAPYLGAPHGASPACNRVLLEPDGTASFAVPAGTFFVYATMGPFATIARANVAIVPGERSVVELTVDPLTGLMPEGALSADFHVHGGASFDSSLPDRDRARSFVATGVDVLAATDHDVVTTYEAAIRALGIGDRVRVMPGVETTGHILFYRPPGSEIPKVVGHFNFWPLRSTPDLPRNGAPWDELLEPGALFDRVTPLYDGHGVAQLNHPYAESSFGRDEGFFTAVGYDPRKTIPSEPSDTPEGQLPRRPSGGLSALDFDVEEVMNGTSTRSFLQYRALWHSLLSQGILRGGTANSDSHTLAIEVLGYPRNIVLGGHSLASFDRERFNADVRAGRIIGTNGPVIVASVDGHGPSLGAFVPTAGAELSLEVRAAPWIPVEEIRVVVNGVLARTIAGSALARPADPFGRAGLVRFSGKLPLAELLAHVPPDTDAWLVIEAGLPLRLAADLDDDGVPDTTDNDGNGVVDARDRAGRAEEDFYVEPKRPAESEARFHAHVIAPGLYPTAFTNPLLLDRAGDGWKAPGLR